MWGTFEKVPHAPQNFSEKKEDGCEGYLYGR